VTTAPLRRHHERGRQAVGVAIVALFLLLGTCAAQAPTRIYLPPPAVAAAASGDVAERVQHVILIAFSGRCGSSRCTPPAENEDALALDTVPALLAAWSSAGLRAEAWTYRGHVDDDPVRGRGYASADADLRAALVAWATGATAPPQLVLLGHSHGTQFAHLLAFEHPQVAFAASILLDSMCLGWDLDHADRLVARMSPGAGPWSATGPYAVGCDVLTVPGIRSRLDLGDVVPWNVARSLELTSGGQVLGLARDARKNVRLDGSDTGIDTAAFPHLNHRAIDEPGQGALEFAAAWLVQVLVGP
jgi:pimeloyl-ACP methyl ester carboxylesterase